MMASRPLLEFAFNVVYLSTSAQVLLLIKYKSSWIFTMVVDAIQELLSHCLLNTGQVRCLLWW